MDGVPRNLQIGGNTRDRPALAVQREHRVPPRRGADDLMVGREPAPDEEGERIFGEDTPHRVVARTPAELDTTDRCDLMVVKGGMLGLEHEDGPLDFVGKGAMALHFRRTEEAGHPLALEARRLSVESALRRAGLASAFGGRMSEEDDGTDEFVGMLLRETDEQVELLPVVGRCEARSVPHRHLPSARG